MLLIDECTVIILAWPSHVILESIILIETLHNDASHARCSQAVAHVPYLLSCNPVYRSGKDGRWSKKGLSHSVKDLRKDCRWYMVSWYRC